MNINHISNLLLTYVKSDEISSSLISVTKHVYFNPLLSVIASGKINHNMPCRHYYYNTCLLLF